MNLNKTKIMIFSKKMTEKNLFYFYYGSNAVELVNSYKYLGIMFYFTGKFKESVANLSDKARKALKSKLHYNNNISEKSWLKLYNSMIAPILTYGSGV